MLDTSDASLLVTAETIVEEYLARQKGVGRFDPKEIRLSDVGVCPRKQTLRILGYPGAERTQAEHGILETGRVWENWLLDRWEEAYPGQILRDVEVQTPYHPGHIDAVNLALGRVLECKATSSRNVRLLPYESNVWQLYAYLHFYGVPHGIYWGELSYVFRDTLEIRSFLFTYDADKGREIEARLQLVADAVRASVPLPVPDEYSPNAFPCSWHGGKDKCPYFDVCW